MILPVVVCHSQRVKIREETDAVDGKVSQEQEDRGNRVMNDVVAGISLDL
jgi:hypothetical protein